MISAASSHMGILGFSSSSPRKGNLVFFLFFYSSGSKWFLCERDVCSDACIPSEGISSFDYYAEGEVVIHMPFSEEKLGLTSAKALK